MRRSKLRILISAYACEPHRGSEPGVGWNVAREAARENEVWVLTRANNRAAIEAAAEENPNLRFLYYDLPGWARFWKRGQQGIRAYYYLWQAGIRRVARQWHERVGFDVAHHVTFVNYWMPSFLAGLPVPFLWGPVGGGESLPDGFWPWLSPGARSYEWGRRGLRRRGEMDPFVRAAARQSAMALATTAETAARLRRLGCRVVRVQSEAGLNEADMLRLGAMPLRDRGALRLMSLGRLVHWKGFEFGLRAFAEFARSDVGSEYWIVGDGPESERLQRLASELGVGGRVRFFGPQPRNKALELLEQCDALVHPSLHDSGGWVCLEAMAAGRPVVCLDWGGPGMQVSEEAGIKIAPVTPEQTVSELSRAFALLGADGALRRRMGEAGRRRVRSEFLWTQRGRALQKIYRELAAGAGRREAAGAAEADPLAAPAGGDGWALKEAD